MKYLVSEREAWESRHPEDSSSISVTHEDSYTVFLMSPGLDRIVMVKEQTILDLQ